MLVVGLLALCSVPLSAAQDHATWEAQGRIGNIYSLVYSDGRPTETFVEIYEILPQTGAFVSIGFICASATDCPTSLLGTCTKAVALSGGNPTVTVTRCVNQHYADCLLFSGYMNGSALFSDHHESGPSCLY